MEIIELVIKDVLKIEAVELRPAKDGITIVTGGNGEGKTSVLKCLWIALGGTRELPDIPIRKGKQKGSIKLDLGEIIIEFHLSTKTGPKLTVRNADGSLVQRPIEVLRDLWGKRAFDPQAFSHMTGADQLETLKRAVGVDTTEIEASHASVFSTRRDLGRDLKLARGRASSMPTHSGLDELEDTSVLLTEMREGVASNATRDQHITTSKRLTKEFAGVVADRQRYQEDLVAKEQAVSDLREMIANATKVMAEKKSLSDVEVEAHAASKQIDVAAIEKRISEQNALRVLHTENEMQAAENTNANNISVEVAKLTDELAELDGRKLAMIASAKFPVKGLGFTDDGVTLNGLPFSQASTAEQLICSANMGLALNPKLRVLIIQDGNAFDDASRETLTAWSKEKKCQIILESWYAGDSPGVVIKDGLVAEVLT